MCQTEGAPCHTPPAPGSSGRTEEKRDGRLEQWGEKRGGRSPAGDVDDEKEKCLFEQRMEGLLQQRRER